MVHDAPLIATVAVGLVLAFAFGMAAQRLRLPPLVGYLLAGVAVGPFTPGFVADTQLAPQLAEIGVILLMFGVGLHFSPGELLAVRGIAVPGAVAQIATATAIGLGLALLMGWDVGAGLVFGLALSVASTVVLLRALEQRNAIENREGRIAVGWLIVEDLAMVLALVLLPALAESLGGESRGLAGQVAGADLALALGATLAKVALFVALVLVIGKRLVPWLLVHVSRAGSRELFTLAVLAVALGIAYGSAVLFGVSFALGAFFAGVVLSESDLSHRAAADSLPLQDAFSVLFFVSVGMLFDPSIVLREPLPLIGVLAVILVGKTTAAFALVLAFGYPLRTALLVSASLAQIGEFSFILAGLGVALGVLPAEGRDLILAGALLSITLNPLAFATVEPVAAWIERRPRLRAALERRGPAQPAERAAAASWPAPSGHAIVVGHGRVGSVIRPALEQAGLQVVVIERDRRRVELLREQGVMALHGDASAAGVLDQAGIRGARLLLLATADSFQARRSLEIARTANPGIVALARAHSDGDVEKLRELGATHVVMGERELAAALASEALRRVGPAGATAPRTGGSAPGRSG